MAEATQEMIALAEEAAFDRHIVETIGWTRFASTHSQASGKEYRSAFKAGYLAHLKEQSA